jgi:hypothetical protein
MCGLIVEQTALKKYFIIAPKRENSSMLETDAESISTLTGEMKSGFKG